MLICLCCVVIVIVGRGGVPSCPPQQQQQQEAMVANHCVLTKTSHPTFNPSLSCCCSHTASVPHPLCLSCLANHPHTIIIHHAPQTTHLRFTAQQTCSTNQQSTPPTAHSLPHPAVLASTQKKRPTMTRPRLLKPISKMSQPRTCTRHGR